MDKPERTCSIEGCSNQRWARGFCHMHYNRIRWRNGKFPVPTAAERFWKKVVRGADDECWLWTGAVQFSRGNLAYGAFRSGNRRSMDRAHRVSYELNIGPIPAGMQIDHICHNTLCVNPAHLQIVSPGQNLQNLRGPQRRTRSGFRGVSWNSQKNKWQVTATVAGVTHQGGFFLDVKEANAAAISLRNRIMTNNLADRSNDDIGTI